MDTIIKAFTIRKLAEQFPNILNRITYAIRPYTTAILYTQLGNDDPPCASGTFVIIGGQKGILTNEHVTSIVIKKNATHVLIPNKWPAEKGEEGTVSLEICQQHNLPLIISLPAKATWPTNSNDGIDISFIPLTPKSCAKIEAIGKQFWNLDQAAESYTRGFFTVSSETLSDYLWATDGNTFEDREIRTDVHGKHWWLPNARPDFLGPRPNIEIHACNYDDDGSDLSYDILRCWVDRETSPELLPKMFCGMSGAALWQIALGTDASIETINLVGIAVSEEFGRNIATDTDLIFHGPIALYKSFYQFCRRKLSN